MKHLQSPRMPVSVRIMPNRRSQRSLAAALDNASAAFKLTAHACLEAAAAVEAEIAVLEQCIGWL